MNPAIEKLKELEAKFLYMILLGIIAVVAVADYALVMRSQMGLVGALNTRTVQLKKDITDLATNKQRRAQFNAQLEIAKQARNNFEAMIHHKNDVPVVLKNVSSIANEYGVKIDQLAPQAVSAAPLVKNEDGKYLTMNIAVRVSCGFHQFGKFLNRLEHDRLFWQLEDLDITGDPKDVQRQDIKMNMKILILEK
ncbi:MAG: type 4a pilus biogenesis protein PilO [Candidatus Omnitrophica bacterium]|nr:type 4a pilus biogenesis protein PilO [Candidatus Omnitrophota bacterium]